MKRPPKLATALIKRFGPDNAALAGDLREAYTSGKSSSWYWRQTLAILWLGRGPQTLATVCAVVAAGLVLELPVLANAPFPLHANQWMLAALYLVPASFVPAIPVGLIVGSLINPVWREWSRKRVLVLAAVTFAIEGWVLPVSNQAYRVTIAGPEVIRGAGELNFAELHAVVMTRPSWFSLFHYNGRVAVSLAPLAFALLVAGVRRLPLAWRRAVVAFAALFYLAYFDFVPETAVRLMPALTAWCPGCIVAAAGFTMMIAGKRGQRRMPA